MLYDKIRKKESALCKLRRKCRQNLKFVSDVGINTFMEDISTSMKAEGIRLLKGIFRNSKRNPKSRRRNFEDKTLALSLHKSSPKSYSFLRVLLLLPSKVGDPRHRSLTRRGVTSVTDAEACVINV